MNAEPITNRIVVGVDFSDTGDHALIEALRLARRLPGSELHIVYVVHADKKLHDAKKLAEMSTELRTRVEEVRAHVTRVGAPEEGSEYTQESVVHVRLGEAAEAIHQVAVDVDADLIVVGTHGRRGIEKLVLGSVAEELIRTARVPVLVAHPKDYSGLPRSERPDPLRPGEDLHPHGISHRLHLSFAPRTPHISGLV